MLCAGTVADCFGNGKFGKDKALLRSWRDSPNQRPFLKDLIAFRERLRDNVLRIESGSPPSDAFLSGGE